MTSYFPEPIAPDGTGGGAWVYMHVHDFFEVGAQQNPNGTWSSLWACEHCPDIRIGALTGPIPDGYCHWCSWVNRNPKKKKCEECGRKNDDLQAR